MMTTHKNQTVEQVETSHDRFIHKNRTGVCVWGGGYLVIEPKPIKIELDIDEMK